MVMRYVEKDLTSLDALFFSVQTLASISYGHRYPVTTYANISVTTEVIFSILCIALKTGLAFARFSLQSARVTFNNVILVSKFDGVPTLMSRAANRRRNQIVEAQISVHLMIDEVRSEGVFMRRLYKLELVRSKTPFFSLCWNVRHKIVEGSPLLKESPESLEKKKAMFIVSLQGIDETVSQPVQARTNYVWPL
jgi:inward rectifier potassium channel